MIEEIYSWRTPKLYIEEWMRTIPGLDRKRLAERMNTTAPTITKKLAAPEKIDQEWIARFAHGLGLEDFTDLYRNPDAPTPADLLKGLDEDQRKEVVSFADYVRNKPKTGTGG